MKSEDDADLNRLHQGLTRPKSSARWNIGHTNIFTLFFKPDISNDKGCGPFSFLASGLTPHSMLVKLLTCCCQNYLQNRSPADSHQQP